GPGVIAPRWLWHGTASATIEFVARVRLEGGHDGRTREPVGSSLGLRCPTSSRSDAMPLSRGFQPTVMAPIWSWRRVATVEPQGAPQPHASLRDAPILFASRPRVKTRGYPQSLAPRGG